MRIALAVTLGATCVAALAVPLFAQGDQGLVVRQLRFSGNRAIDDYSLKTVIATTESGFFARNPLVRWIGLGEKRFFDETEFRRDVIRLRLYYRQSGYMGAVVDTTVRRTARDVFITLRIHEGQPVRVRQFEITGLEGVVNLERRRKDLPLQVGDPFNRFLYQATADTILSWLHNLGYPYAQVFRALDANAALQQADVALEFVTGPRARVGRVDVLGLEDVDTGAVRGMLSVRPGDLYQRDKLYQTQRDLYAMGVFRSANVVLADSLPPEDPADTLVRVVVQTDEGPRHRVRFGLGYGTVECIRTQAGWTAYDFLGGARALDITARTSKIGVGQPFDAGLRGNICRYLIDDPTSDSLAYNVGVTLRQPVFFSPRHNASIGLFAERRSEYQVYTRSAIGVNAAVTFNARRAVPVTLSYGYSVGRTQVQQLATYCSVFRACTDADQAALASRRAFAALTLAAVRDRTNSPFEPSRGSIVNLTVSHASPLLGSDSAYAFNRGELQVTRYHSLGRQTVLAWRVRLGTILPETFTLSSQAVQFVPPDQRFYAGGPNSVRGFRLNDLGPRVYVTDSLATDTIINGDTIYTLAEASATGGNSLFLASAELRFPAPAFLPQRVRFGAFVDLGQVYERERVISFENIRVTPGVGVRVATPLGPVRLDVAYNGYPPEQGPVLQPSATGFTELSARYPRTPRAPASFWDRLVFQFAIGQAY